VSTTWVPGEVSRSEIAALGSGHCHGVPMTSLPRTDRDTETQTNDRLGNKAMLTLTADPDPDPNSQLLHPDP
jgi:hypothetical protein